MKSKTIFRIVFIAWGFIWLLFLVRGLVKGEAQEYKDLFGKTLEEKRMYVAREDLYDFILFLKATIPEDSDYKVLASYDDWLDSFFVSYHMLPTLQNLDNPEYIACYKKRKFSEKGYQPIAVLSKYKYIVKRALKKSKNMQSSLIKRLDSD